MESLAILAALIISPAMFGGPLALLLSLHRPAQASRLRKIAIYLLSVASTTSGLFLILGRISQGALAIGLLGALTGLYGAKRVFQRNP